MTWQTCTYAVNMSVAWLYTACTDIAVQLGYSRGCFVPWTQMYVIVLIFIAPTHFLMPACLVV